MFGLTFPATFEHFQQTPLIMENGFACISDVRNKLTVNFKHWIWKEID